jgi:hypothetical protein
MPPALDDDDDRTVVEARASGAPDTAASDKTDP